LPLATMAPKSASLNAVYKEKGSGETSSSKNEKEEVSGQSMMESMMQFMTDMKKDIVSKLDAVLARVVKVEDTLADHEGKFSSVIERLDKMEEKMNGRQEETKGMEGVKEMLANEVMEMKEIVKRECQIRITGLKEEVNESALDLKGAIAEVFEGKMKVIGASSMIVDVFRVGKPTTSEERPRVAIARVHSVFQRNQILRGKSNLSDWKHLGVDMDRTPKQVEEAKAELSKRKAIIARGGKARWVKGKVVEVPQESDGSPTRQVPPTQRTYGSNVAQMGGTDEESEEFPPLRVTRSKVDKDKGKK
jgi:archaellum component FlaC